MPGSWFMWSKICIGVKFELLLWWLWKVTNKSYLDFKLYLDLDKILNGNIILQQRKRSSAKTDRMLWIWISFMFLSIITTIGWKPRVSFIDIWNQQYYTSQSNFKFAQMVRYCLKAWSMMRICWLMSSIEIFSQCSQNIFWIEMNWNEMWLPPSRCTPWVWPYTLLETLTLWQNYSSINQ